MCKDSVFILFIDNIIQNCNYNFNQQRDTFSESAFYKKRKLAHYLLYDTLTTYISL